MQRAWIRLALTVFLISSLPVATTTGVAEEMASHQTARRITLDDEYRLRDISNPTLAPDGTRVAYTVTTHDFEENESTDRIWMMTLDGAEPVPMTAKQISSWAPRFSADGSRLYFLSARHDDETQIWFLDLVHGGEAQQLTHLPRGCSAINFSPDERSLVVVYKDLDEDREEGEPWVVDRLQFKRDYTGYLDRRRRHLYVYDIESEQLTQLTSGDYDDSTPAWSPDGKTIAFVSNRSERPDGNYNSDIWLVDVRNRDKGQNLVQVTSNAGPDAEPCWFPDGKSIAYVASPDLEAGHYATQHLAVVTLLDRQHQLFTESLDRNVSGLKFSPDGKTLYFNLEDSGENHLARMPATGGKVTRPLRGRVSVSDYALGGNATIAAVMSSADRPPELFVVVGPEQPRQLTRLNTELMNTIQLGETEEVHFKSHDGLEIEGFITKPPHYNPALRYPAIVRIHGGPFSQYSHGFSFQAHLLAARDYVVIRCNPRGSSGYGREFAMGLYQGWGEKDYRDILAAADHAIQLGYADPQRLGVGGFSYGGILTNYLITQTDRFKAAVSGAGSALYVASYGHDEYQRWYEWEIGLPWENRELWERLSPFNYVQNVKTPTLFMCGEKDWNVPVQNSEQMYQALRRLGIPTRLVVYPGEHHGGWSFQHSKDYTERLLAWYDRHLKAGGAKRDPAED